MRDCPILKDKGREYNQDPPNGSKSNAQKCNHIYALQSQRNQESSPYVVTGMLEVVFIDIYVFLEHGAFVLLLHLLWL